MKEPLLFHVYDYAEIISRYYALLSHIEGPSCFPFEIHLDAGNTTEPPTISVAIYEPQSDGSDLCVYDSSLDQNTPYSTLDYELLRLKDDIEFIIYAIEHQISYHDAVKVVTDARKSKKDNNDDLPF